MLEQTAPFPWQQSIWGNLMDQYRQQRLPHAILLTGIPGIGKSAFAVALADALLCSSPDENGQACGTCRSCQLNAAGSHPDKVLISPEEGKKSISINQIRELLNFQSLKSQYSGHKVIVIQPADAMNANAANALLKTLEEPTAETILILTTSRVSALLPTIRSRCQLWTLPTAKPEQARDWLQAQGVENAPALLGMSGGAPLLAQQMAQSDALTQRQQIFDVLVQVARGEVGAARSAAQWEKLEPGQLFGWLYGWVADLVRLKTVRTPPHFTHPDHVNDLQQLAQAVDLGSLYRLQDRLTDALRLLHGQVNKPLQLEEFVIDWGRSFRIR